MKNVFGFFVIILLLSGLGCAHLHEVEGPQEKSEIPAGIRVGVGSSEVKEGDVLAVYKTVCHRLLHGQRLRRGSDCHVEQVGSAVVLKILDHDSSIVSPQNGLIMDNSMKVEKQEGEKK